ncbi:hypothetical protein [Helicobacter sp.]|nr:hypothetical protein [Helicobacter sp.]
MHFLKDSIVLFFLISHYGLPRDSNESLAMTKGQIESQNKM